ATVPSPGELGFSWAVSRRSSSRHLPCGDAVLVREIEGVTLFAVADGAGRGGEAAIASRVCLEGLESAETTDLSALFALAHRSAKKGRGVALGLACFAPERRELTWGAIGDIDGLIFNRRSFARRERSDLLQRGGVVGYHETRPLTQTTEVGGEDRVVMTSDGLRRAYRNDTHRFPTPEAAADGLLARYGRPDDDAIVLVVDFLEGP
ncbi:MAG: serine/threonine-protein phosphatase, partial [Neomegalonema sp.]|nr:serine/threonine-protein phosphatase [Neomegalonema sp.]